MPTNKKAASRKSDTKPAKRSNAVAKVKSALTAAEQKQLKRLLAKAGSDTVVEVPRLKSEGKKSRNTSRPFWIDGTHAYLRRKKANPGIIERVANHVKSGDYRHVRTSDDVEIYEIADSSPLRRKQLDVTMLTEKGLERVIVRAACQHDFKLYYDAVSELAYRIKNGTVSHPVHGQDTLPEGQAQSLYIQVMQYIELRIMRRGGPTPMMIQAELKAVREKRTGSKIYLPPSARSRH